MAGPHPGGYPVPAGAASTTDRPPAYPADAAQSDAAGEPRPGEPGWPPPPGTWQPPAGASPAAGDRRGSGWAPRPNGTD